MAGQSAASPSFATALRYWARLGCVNFGGPAGQIAMMHRDLVVERRWIDEPRFLHALNFCSLLPGPEAQQLATYVGWTLHGMKGGLVAGILFVLPSIFVLLVLSWAYAAHGALPAVAAVLAGVKAVVVAIVLDAVLRIGQRALRTPLALTLAAAAFAAVAAGIAFPWVVLGAGLVGALGGNLLEKTEKEKASSKEGVGEPESTLSPVKPASGWRRSLRISAYAIALWLLPFLLVFSLLGIESLPARLYLFFTQAAFVTFGGAYAVLSYVNQAAVTELGWITAAQAVDGLGLAESTPGPLIMVLQFVGFMAGWRAPGGLSPASSAVLCGLLTSWATFLPSLTFVLIGAPYIERLQQIRRLAGALAAILAAVTGVILHLALTFGAHVLLPEGLAATPAIWSLLLSGTAFVALRVRKISPALLVLAGALLGFAAVQSAALVH
jgi:chromate transporter